MIKRSSRMRVLVFTLAASALGLAPAAAQVQVGRIQSVRPSLPVTQLNVIARPDVPLLVGGTAGYALRLPAMATKDAFELGKGFAIGRTTAPPVLAEAPNGDLLSLVPGDVPRRFVPFPEPRWEAMNFPAATSMVVREGNLYGVSSATGQVFKYDFASGQIETFGTKGEAPGQFKYPEQIAVDRAGRIYIADHNRIIRIDDISGSGWASFGKKGSGRGEFNYIKGLAVDRDARVYAVDIFNNRLVKIDNMLGDGWSELGFSAPNCVATDDFGRIYVCEAESWRLTRIDKIDGSGRVAVAASRSAEWPFGSFGHVTPARRGQAQPNIR